MFKRDPVNLIRFFARAEQTDAFFHPNAVRLLRRSLRLIDDTLRNDPEANRIFLELLCSDKNPEPTLRRMNEAGVLGRFVPDFGKVVSMMQFNMYHHYTVDEHLIRTVGVLSDIEHGAAAEPHPLSTSIIKTIQHRRALYVAAFLHDIAKGRAEDHSIGGARIARTLCPRFGLSAAETETVAWLIEHHLLMSQIAFSRDISDPKTIRDFADVVQSPGAAEAAAGADRRRHPRGRAQRLERLEGPAAARALLRDRAGGRRRAHPARRARPHRRARRTPSVPRSPIGRPEEVEHFIDRHYPDYWLRTDTRKVVEHFKLVSCRRGRPDRSSPARSPPTPSPPSPSFRCSRPTIPACWRCLRAPVPPPAPTSRVRTSRRRATASRSTRSCSPASSTRTRTSCAARAGSPRPSRSCSRARSGSVR